MKFLFVLSHKHFQTSGRVDVFGFSNFSYVLLFSSTCGCYIKHRIKKKLGISMRK